MAIKRTKSLKLNEKVHAIYLRAMIKPMRYNVFFGGKWTGKSYAIAMLLIFKFLNSGKGDMLVLRKFNKDHTSSTYKTLKKAIRIIHEMVHDSGHNFQHHWKFTKSPSPEIEYLPTGRKIYFAGMDDPGRVAGITTDDPDAFIQFVWYEEPIEVADLKSISKLEQQILAGINFEVVEDSALRPPIEFDNELCEIFFTMNSWKLTTSWIFDKFRKLFSLFKYDDKDIMETVEELEKNGYIAKEDPSFMGGQGLRVVHTCYRVLEDMGFLSSKQLIKHKDRKEYNWEEYLLVSLGIPKEDETFKFKKHRDTLSRETDDLSERIPKCIGVDIGQLHDYSVLEALWTKVKFDWEAKRYREIHDKMVFKGELVIKDSSLKTQAKIMIDWIIKLAEKNPLVYDLGIDILVDKTPDFKLIEPFKDAILKIQLEEKLDLSWIKIKYAPKTNKVGNQIGDRISKWDELIRDDRLVIYKENKMLYSTLINTEIDKTGKRIEDKRVMDAVNAAEHPLNKYYPYMKLYKKRYRKKEAKKDTEFI